MNVDDQTLLDVDTGGHRVMIVRDIGRKLSPLDYVFDLDTCTMGSRKVPPTRTALQ
jgi:hypothetical protein